MSEYERTLSVEAPADAVFEYVSEVKNVPALLPEADGAEFETDREGREVEWTGKNSSGSIQVDTGDVSAELSEITLRLSFAGRRPSDPPRREDEKTLENMDRALESIRQHVEHAHRAGKANFM
jgi:hypothetical protein